MIKASKIIISEVDTKPVFPINVVFQEKIEAAGCVSQYGCHH